MQGDYYASKSQAGASRLGEILEESAFYSEKLQLTSSRTMAGLMILFFAILALAAFATIPQAKGDILVSGVKISLALLVFIMSSDVLGAYFAHSSSAKLIRDVRIRLMNIKSNEIVIGDVLLALGDYNAAVESAPESVPFAYELKKKKLNTLWKEYQKDKLNVA